MTIGRRILISLSLLTIIFLLQGFISIRSLDTVNQKSTEIADGWLPQIILMSDTRKNVNAYFASKQLHSLTIENKEMDALEQRMAASKEQVKGNLAKLAALEGVADNSGTSEKGKLIESFKTDWDTFVSNTETDFIPESRKGYNTAAAKGNIASSKGLSDKITTTIDRIIELNTQGSIAASAEGDVIYNDIQKVIGGFILLTLLAALALGWYMKAGAQQISQTIKTSVEQLTNLSLALSASTQQASAGAQQNASIAQQVANGATLQSKQAEEISKALSEMSQAVRQMVTTGQEVSATTVKASKLAQQTGESTEKISKMVDVVTSTAEQTNLLALNAAIEAARAGEAGRGFAVVADEVRKLADSSSKAADEVQTIVKEIGGSIATTVKSIGQSSLKIDDVATNINEQAAAITQIAKTMDSIASVAEQSAAGAQQLSASTQQTSAATQQVAAASTDLQRLASQLQKIAGNTQAINDQIAASAEATDITAKSTSTKTGKTHEPK